MKKTLEELTADAICILVFPFRESEIKVYRLPNPDAIVFRIIYTGELPESSMGERPYRDVGFHSLGEEESKLPKISGKYTVRTKRENVYYSYMLAFGEHTTRVVFTFVYTDSLNMHHFYAEEPGIYFGGDPTKLTWIEAAALEDSTAVVVEGKTIAGKDSEIAVVEETKTLAG